VKETVDAKKTRFGPDDLDTVLAGTTRVLAARGKKILEFKLKDLEDPAALQKAVIGPSGNLRAPAAKLGKTMLVGFNPDMWTDVAG